MVSLISQFWPLVAKKKNVYANFRFSASFVFEIEPVRDGQTDRQTHDAAYYIDL